MTDPQLLMTDSKLRFTPRERVATALRHAQPDRVPTGLLATPEIWKRLSDHQPLPPAVPDLAEYILKMDDRRRSIEGDPSSFVIRTWSSPYD
jgi:hypothetical protein